MFYLLRAVGNVGGHFYVYARSNTLLKKKQTLCTLL